METQELARQIFQAEGDTLHDELTMTHPHDFGLDWHEWKSDEPLTARLKHLDESEPGATITVAGFTLTKQKSTGDANYTSRLADDNNSITLFLNTNTVRHATHQVRLTGKLCEQLRRGTDMTEFERFIDQVNQSLFGKALPLESLLPARMDPQINLLCNRAPRPADFGYDPELPMHHPENWSLTCTKLTPHIIQTTIQLGTPAQGKSMILYDSTAHPEKGHERIDRARGLVPDAELFLLRQARINGFQYNPETLGGRRTIARCEWRLNRAELRKFGICNLRDMHAAIRRGNLWWTLTNNLARVVQGRDTNITRDVTADWWKTLQNATGTEEPMQTVPNPPATWETYRKRLEHEIGHAMRIAEEYINPETIQDLFRPITDQLERIHEIIEEHGAATEEQQRFGIGIERGYQSTDQKIGIWKRWCQALERLREACQIASPISEDLLQPG